MKKKIILPDKKLILLFSNTSVHIGVLVETEVNMYNQEEFYILLRNTYINVKLIHV